MYHEFIQYDSGKRSRFTDEFIANTVDALRWYLDNRPNHEYGLCRWLADELRDFDGGYDIVHAARTDIRCSFPTNNAVLWRDSEYVSPLYGQQPERVQFAYAILQFLKESKPLDFIEASDVTRLDSITSTQNTRQVREASAQCAEEGSRPARGNHP